MENPYASPEAETLTKGSSEDEAIRNEHLNYEANVRALGILFYLNAFFMILGGAGTMLALSEVGATDGLPMGFYVILGGVLIALGVLYFFAGRGLRDLQPWARIVAIVLSIIGLLGFPIGTVISILILYLLFSRKGKFVFQPEYQGIVERTPHIKYKTSIIVWILLGLVVALVLFAVLVPMFVGV